VTPPALATLIGIPSRRTTNMTTKMPPKQLSGSRSPAPLRELTRPDTGLRLPPFQRPALWTPAQQISFIESAWSGYSLGEVVITETADPVFDRLIIDGQQRLGAVAAYLAGAFPVFGFRWSDLDPAEQRIFGQDTVISVFRLSEGLTWPLLEDIYTRMNYGGTPHRPEDHPDALRGGQ